jgi:hypothetical protein
MLFGVLSAGLILVTFVVPLFRSPEKLQSEGHQIQLEALGILAEQGRANNLKAICLEGVISRVIGPLQGGSGR